MLIAVTVAAFLAGLLVGALVAVRCSARLVARLPQAQQIAFARKVRDAADLIAARSRT